LEKKIIQTLRNIESINKSIENNRIMKLIN
jgi:hypothetical protein